MKLFNHAQNSNKRYIPSIRVLELERENRLLRKELGKEIEEKDNRITALEEEMRDLKLLVAELQELLFRGQKTKKNKRNKNDKDNDNSGDGSNNNQPRSKDSYRRPIPLQSEITKEEEYTLDNCLYCGGTLEKIDQRIIYLEDIIESAKEMIKQIINVYQCSDCGKIQSKIPIPRGHNVRLGKRIKTHILYDTYVLNASFRDVIRTYQDKYNISISKGEIRYIQQESAKKLRPAYNGIHQELLEQESVNMDETGWKIKGILNYLWNLCSPTTDATLFHIGNRGKGNAEKLLKDFNGCLTSDCYGAYKKLELEHQVCWVHILRKVKDLTQSDYLSKEQLESAQNFYDGLINIYRQLKEALDKPYRKQKRQQMQQDLIKQLQSINQLLPCDTPKKLKNIKLQTQEYETQMFTCLDFKTALAENNLAERNLRHVVLKRKKSFGSQTEKGAQIYAINASVILTYWKRFQGSFMPRLAEALGN
jgi:hypothetical protein